MPASTQTERSILVVDDDPTFCAIMKELLTRQGYGVRVAHSVRDALASLQCALPELILTDIMMPEVDGLQLLRTLRENPNWAGIPTVVVSACVLETDRQAARAAGAIDFVGKPFTFKRLTSTIQPLLYSAQVS